MTKKKALCCASFLAVIVSLPPGVEWASAVGDVPIVELGSVPDAARSPASAHRRDYDPLTVSAVGAEAIQVYVTSMSPLKTPVRDLPGAEHGGEAVLPGGVAGPGPCVCDLDCADGNDCTANTCVAGVCTVDDTSTGSCSNDGDGQFCVMGTCDGAGNCQDNQLGGDPCDVGEVCNETLDRCDGTECDQADTFDTDCDADDDATNCIGGYCRDDFRCRPRTLCGNGKRCDGAGTCVASAGRCCDGTQSCTADTFTACAGDWAGAAAGSECTPGCPKYSTGFTELSSLQYDVAATEPPCTQFNRVGDDYTLANTSYLSLETFSFVGGVEGTGDGTMVFEFYDGTVDPPVQVFAASIQFTVGGPNDQTGNFFWTITLTNPTAIPHIGWLVMRPGTGSGETVHWLSSDVVGSTGANNENLMWINDGQGTFLQTLNPAAPDVFAFELQGTKIPDPIGACCDPIAGTCSDTVAHLCLDGGGNFLAGLACIDNPCQDGACCSAPTGCEVIPPGACPGPPTNFLGFGTTCDPDCCPQTPTGADDCGAATMQNLTVPFDGFGDPVQGGVVVTLSGDTTPATGGDCPALDPDLGWWESFSIDVEAKVTIDLCCDDDIPTASYIIVYENCNAGVCADSNFSDDNGRGSPVCSGGDNNLWNVWNALPAGDYFYPVFADPTDDPLNLGDYQLHIRAEGLPKQACCFGEICDDSITAPECERQGGFSLPGVPICALANCGLGACCEGAGVCNSNGDVGMTAADCAAAGGDYVGGARCSDNPCPVCEIDQPGNCQRDTGAFIVLTDRSRPDGQGNISRWADDFTPATSGQIDSICWWPAFLNPDQQLECSAPGEPPPDDWIARIYDDIGGLPGGEITAAGGVPIQVDAKISLGGASRVWQYAGNLQGAGPIVTGGECYWLEITGLGEGPDGCAVYWTLSADANQYSVNDTDGTYGPEDVVTSVGTPPDPNVDLAFCLGLGLAGNGCGVFTGACCQCGGACDDGVAVDTCVAGGGFFFPGDVCANVSCPGTTPANDDCGNQDVLTHPGGDMANPIVVDFDIRCASTDGPRTPVNTCAVSGFDEMLNDIWYEYHPDCGGTLTVSMCPDDGGFTDYDSLLVVYGDGSTCTCPQDDTTQLACGDSDCGIVLGPSRVDVPVVAGGCYLIRVGGSPQIGSGRMVITLAVQGQCQVTLESPLPEEWSSPVRVACASVADPICPDEAYCVPAPDGSFPGVCYAPKNRYVSVAPNPNNAGVSTARRVSLDTGGTPLVLGWMGPPAANGLVRIVDEASRHYTDWSMASFPIWCVQDVHCPNMDCNTASRTCGTGTTDVVQVGDCQTSPGHTYLIEAIAQGASIADPANYSAPLSLATVNVWGDAIGATVGGGAFNMPADGGATFGDILGVVKGFQGQGASPPAWLDLVAVSGTDPIPDYAVGFGDILATVKGFQNQPYALDDPCTCIGQPPCP